MFSILRILNGHQNTSQLNVHHLQEEGRQSTQWKRATTWLTKRTEEMVVCRYQVGQTVFLKGSWFQLADSVRLTFLHRELRNQKKYCEWKTGWKTTSALGLFAGARKPSRIRIRAMKPTHEFKLSCVMWVSRLISRATWQWCDLCEFYC